jgi:hypothetical protein
LKFDHSLKIAGNGSDIAEGGEFQHRSLIKELMLSFVLPSNRSRSTQLWAIDRACCCAGIQCAFRLNSERGRR